jgi:hypothetical protein
MKPALVILAAGLGSRYGGMKQLAPIGPRGETLLEYSVFDSLRVGFSKVVLVVHPETEIHFRTRFDNAMANHVSIDYVAQSLSDLPNGFPSPSHRVKPWGTAHAVLAVESVVTEPFAVLNADDFYGAKSLESLFGFLSSNRSDRRSDLAVVGFPIAQTLTDAGPVSRALCNLDESGYLETIVELARVWRQNGRVLYDDAQGCTQTLSGNELVSMNMWGFTPELLPEIRRHFSEFLAKNQSSPEREFLLPEVIQSVVENGAFRVSVLRDSGQWCGLTFREDLSRVGTIISALIDQGHYPEELWS